MSTHTFTPRQQILIAATLRTAANFYGEYDGTTSYDEIIDIAERIDDADSISTRRD